MIKNPKYIPVNVDLTYDKVGAVGIFVKTANAGVLIDDITVSTPEAA